MATLPWFLPWVSLLRLPLSPLRERVGEGVSTTRGLYPSRGRRAFEAHGLAADRVSESQAGRMQTEPSELSPGPAVLAVTDDGVTDGGQLYPDLAPASRAERKLEACRVLPARQHPIVRDSRP